MHPSHVAIEGAPQIKYIPRPLTKEERKKEIVTQLACSALFTAALIIYFVSTHRSKREVDGIFVLSLDFV